MTSKNCVIQSRYTQSSCTCTRMIERARAQGKNHSLLRMSM